MPSAFPKLLARAGLAALIGVMLYRVLRRPPRPDKAADLAPFRHEPARGRLRWRRVGFSAVALAILVACAGAWLVGQRERHIGQQANIATGGVRERAIPIMLANGCAGCHTIAGVPAAQGRTGPVLDSTLAQRIYIAGELPNNPGNMIRWLRFSRGIDPHTAMPSTGISEQDARDIAAYLYGLR